MNIQPQVLCMLIVTSFAAPAFAQAPAASTASVPQEEEAILLSPFDVTATKLGRYQSDESASGGRIRTDIMETPASVTVFTREFIDDLGALRVLDAAKYAAGISEATIPNALDRVNIRGFQSDGRRVDGFSWSDQANYDTAGIDRTEIIKGPDSLLQPTGVPGGTINLVTKRPQFKRADSVTVQAGQYDGNRVELDSTGPMGNSQKLAYRFVTSYQDSDGYVARTNRKSFLFTPSLTWRIANNTQLTVRYEYYNFKAASMEGLPVDPSVGTNSDFRLLDGLAKDFSPALSDEYSFRRVEVHTGTFLLTSTISDNLSVRLAGRFSEDNTPDTSYSWGPTTPGGSRNPLTGFWEGGLIYSTSAPYEATAAPVLGRTFNHTGSSSDQHLRYRDLQNDWVYTFEFPSVDTTTMAGFAYGFEHQNQDGRNWTATPFNIDNFVVDTAEPIPAATLSNARRRELSRTQFYLTEKAELFKKRVIVSAGVANIAYNGYYGSKISTAAATGVAGRMYPGEGNKTTYNYGFVVKPIKQVSVYYGHSESALPTSNYQSVAERLTQDGIDTSFSVGKQDEVGVKTQWLDNRLMLSVAYYEINQTNYSIANPANLTSPRPPTTLPALLVDRVAKGWEYQLVANLTKSLSLVANYNDTTNRDINNVPFRGAAEKSSAAFVRYEFKSGALKGFASSIGANYLSKRAGDSATGFTSVPTNIARIPNQPSFYLPARTLADLNLSYSRGPFVYRLAVNNLFDKLDYAASQTRSLVYVGNPRNVSGSVNYKF